MWIGLQRDDRNSHFEWSEQRGSGGEYTKWADGEPENIEGLNCVFIGPRYFGDKQYRGKWGTDTCSKALYHVMCEF